MQFDDTLAAARKMESDLGAAAFVMLAALEAGGADPDTLARVRESFDAWLPRVGEDDARTLAAVLEARLAENHERGAFDGAVQLASRLTTLEAHIVHDALAEQGVATRMRHDGPTAADFPDPPSQVELWVRPRDLDRARKVLREMSAAAGENITCPHCAEPVPANFAVCWSCGGTV
ncbi:MAG: DUF2007 domain-containing protein [bacterium]|nr:DUF2007 domain-containing protein [Myxococcales bacterium]